jgi:hypothetical protein
MHARSKLRPPLCSVSSDAVFSFSCNYWAQFQRTGMCLRRRKRPDGPGNESRQRGLSDLTMAHRQPQLFIRITNTHTFTTQQQRANSQTSEKGLCGSELQREMDVRTNGTRPRVRIAYNSIIITTPVPQQEHKVFAHTHNLPW